MKLIQSVTVLICLLSACITLHAQVPNYPNLPPEMKAQMEKMQKQALKNAGIETDESSLASFVKKIKTINIGEDTSDDVVSKLGKPYSRSSSSGTEQLNYMFMPGHVSGETVVSSIQIGASGKVSCVKVSKVGQHGSEELYVKGIREMPGMAQSSSTPKESVTQSDHFPLKDAPPDNPTEGQYYFNKTDKHTYVYNGTEWVQIDNSKIKPQ